MKKETILGGSKAVIVFSFILTVANQKHGF